MDAVTLRNTSKAMKAVPCMDGHIYHIMPNARASIPDEVDGELPEGVIKVVVPSKASPQQQQQYQMPRPMNVTPNPSPTINNMPNPAPNNNT